MGNLSIIRFVSYEKTYNASSPTGSLGADNGHEKNVIFCIILAWVNIIMIIYSDLMRTNVSVIIIFIFVI